MNREIRYSVIIPICNGEKTLARCLDSLLGQGRQDVQIILIDDGSWDASGEIAAAYAEKHPRITCIFQENCGVSRARNRGLDLAEGTYITFVDCDDFVTEDYFSRLDQKTEADLLIFSNRLTGMDQPRLMEALLRSRVIMSPCNKRFKRRLIEKARLRFSEDLDVGEDFLFCFSYGLACGQIALCPQEIYRADLSNQNSLSRRYRPQLTAQIQTLYHRLREADREGVYGAELDYLYARHVFSCIAEEWKVKKLPYLQNRKAIGAVCDAFRQPIASGCCGMFHWILRRLLAWKLDYPVYLAAYLGKGRAFQKQARVNPWKSEKF